MKKTLGLLALATLAMADVARISTGTSIVVRTNESINAKKGDDRVFTGVVDQDVTDINGYVAIPKGSAVELIVKKAANKELALDLESITVSGQRYAVSAGARQLSSSQPEEIGKNNRTSESAGGGAALGAIIGAVAGAGAGAQVMTRGKSVRVSSESLLTFRLEQPLGATTVDTGITRNGRHYHQNR